MANVQRDDLTWRAPGSEAHRNYLPNSPLRIPCPNNIFVSRGCEQALGLFRGQPALPRRFIEFVTTLAIGMVDDCPHWSDELAQARSGTAVRVNDFSATDQIRFSNFVQILIWTKILQYRQEKSFAPSVLDITLGRFREIN